MNEEITEREEFIKIVSILSFSDLHPADCKYITHFIIDLAKENQQLKEQLKLVESLTCFNMPNDIPMVCMTKADYERNKYEYETLDKYKSVLDEIREYINDNVAVYAFNNPGLPHWEFNDDDIETILQILDKVKENERGTTKVS